MVDSTNNFDTIFSKSVIINYLENKIVGEYLDFNLKKHNDNNKNVKYSNSKTLYLLM